MVFAWCCNINVKHGTALVTYTYGIAVQFAVLIWLSRIAIRGVPLMLHEGCGVIVIAMSPARGYYDSKLYYDGLRLQAAREAFGVCKSLFVETGDFSKLTTHLRGVYISDHHFQPALADGPLLSFCEFHYKFCSTCGTWLLEIRASRYRNAISFAP
jgi:hypothetical protein